MMRHEQVQNRDTRGIVRLGNHIFACSAIEGHDKIGIVKYTEGFRTAETMPLARDLHGLAVQDGHLLVIDAERDTILHVSPGLELIREEYLLSPSPGQTRYHFNDVCVAGRTRIVSSFGGWPPKEGDGFITSDIAVLITDVHHPHSVCFAQDHLFWCASASGSVMIATITGDKQTRCLARLPGYTRGLLPDPDEFFVGEGISQDRLGGNPLKTARLSRFRFASYAADPDGLVHDCVNLPADNVYAVARV